MANRESRAEMASLRSTAGAGPLSAEKTDQRPRARPEGEGEQSPQNA